MRWYEQAGTPTLNVKRAGTKIEFEQILPATPGQNKKAPQVIPVKWQVIGDDGALSEPQVTILTTQKTTVDLPETALKHEPFSLSLIQDFSAPVILDFNQDTDSVLRLMAHDPNAFNRWEAGQSLARNWTNLAADALINPWMIFTKNGKRTRLLSTNGSPFKRPENTLMGQRA